MRAYKSYKYMANCKLYHNDKAIPIASDVEHIPLIANIIRGRKIGFYVRQVFPFSFFSDFIPTFQCDFCISMSFRFIKLNQSFM